VAEWREDLPLTNFSIRSSPYDGKSILPDPGCEKADVHVQGHGGSGIFERSYRCLRAGQDFTWWAHKDSNLGPAD
jgi:hypothetical protein